jgi:hypothetical protein
MKPSKKVWIIVGIGIFAIVLGSLYTFYFREVGEREQLRDRLAAAEALLPGLAAARGELEDQLAQATSLLNKNQAEFPESVESIEYDDDLFAIADHCSVDITRLTASMPTSKIVGTVTYSISSFVVVVSGDIDGILDFIYAIRTGDDFQLPWSAEVTVVNIASGTATINLDIYGYQR